MATAVVTAHCHECGREWETTPKSLYNGKGCGPCRAKANGRARRLSIEDIRNRIHHDIIILDGYRGKATKLHARCRICHHEWFPLAGNLFKGDICPKCEDRRSGEKMRLTQQEVINRLYTVSPKIEVIGKYQGAHQPLEVRCRNCGYHWVTQSPWRLSMEADVLHVRAMVFSQTRRLSSIMSVYLIIMEIFSIRLALLIGP